MISGIDVSSYQGQIDWKTMKQRGYDFTFIKATEGQSWVDKCFMANWVGAKLAGLATGAYHFFHPAQDVGNQVHQFLTTMGDLRDGDLPPVLDWEITNNIDPDKQKQAAMKWLTDVEKALGVVPIIYGSPSFFEDLGDLSAFSRFGLWIAHYGVASPIVPAPWKDYLFWQTNSIRGLDYDSFNGTEEELASITFRKRP